MSLLRPVVFLDFDGVIMTRSSYMKNNGKPPRPEGPTWTRDHAMSRMDPEIVSRVSDLCVQIRAEVVLSTSWRNLYDNGPIIEALYLSGLDRRVEVVGATPSFASRYRGAEIRAWLDEHRPLWTMEDVLVLDDDSDLEPFLARWVRSTFDEGFTEANHAEALALFATTTHDDDHWPVIERGGPPPSVCRKCGSSVVGGLCLGCGRRWDRLDDVTDEPVRVVIMAANSYGKTTDGLRHLALWNQWMARPHETEAHNALWRQALRDTVLYGGVEAARLTFERLVRREAPEPFWRMSSTRTPSTRTPSTTLARPWLLVGFPW